MGGRCADALGVPAPLEAPRLAALPRPQLEAMRAAGREILECRRVLHKAGLNLVGEVLRGQGSFYEYNHYPENDVYDDETRAQYYYHAHRGMSGEHGHFHTFLRPVGDGAPAHLIAISMDPFGEPIGLFATNRWVTGDAWYEAPEVIAMLERFRIDHAAPSWPLNRWISAMFVLYRPHIEALLLERDRVIEGWRRVLGTEDVLERRDLEILANLPVSVEETLAQVEKELS